MKSPIFNPLFHEQQQLNLVATSAAVPAVEENSADDKALKQ